MTVMPLSVSLGTLPGPGIGRDRQAQLDRMEDYHESMDDQDSVALSGGRNEPDGDCKMRQEVECH